MNGILDAHVNLHLKNVMNSEEHAAALQTLVEMARDVFDASVPVEAAPNYVSFRILAKEKGGPAHEFELAVMRPDAENPVQVATRLRGLLAERETQLDSLSQEVSRLLATIEVLRARIDLEGRE